MHGKPLASELALCGVLTIVRRCITNVPEANMCSNAAGTCLACCIGRHGDAHLHDD
jgi:hypothetical protein